MREYLPMLGIVLGIGWLITRPQERVVDYSGTWLQKEGKGILYIRQHGKALRAEYTPGNRAELYTLQGVIDGGDAVFYGRIRGTPWFLKLSFDGKLTGWRDAESYLEEFDQRKQLPPAMEQKRLDRAREGIKHAGEETDLGTFQRR